MQGSRAVSTWDRRRSLVRSRQRDGAVSYPCRVQFGCLRARDDGTVGTRNRARTGYSSVTDNGGAVVHLRVGLAQGSGTDRGVDTGHRQDYFGIFQGRPKSAKRVAAGHSRAGRGSACGTMATFANATVTVRVRCASPGKESESGETCRGSGRSAWVAGRQAQRGCGKADVEVFENHRGSETQKYRFYKGLGYGKGLGITHIGIVNARESEAPRVPRLTSLVCHRAGGGQV